MKRVRLLVGYSRRADSMNSFSHTGAERELFKQIARKNPSPSRMRARSRVLRHRAQFVLPSTLTAMFLLAALAAGVLGVAATFGLSALLTG
jgi:hypothetical protein